MSQPVGFQYKSRIPTLSDDASIVEALKVYHYGVDDYTTQPIPDDSIEGNFRSLNISVTSIQSQLSTLSNNSIVRTSPQSSPNNIVAENDTVVPLTITSREFQTSFLQQWRNNLGVNVASVSRSGLITASSMKVSGTQSLADFRIRNIQASTSEPSGGNDGDVWFIYT